MEKYDHSNEQASTRYMLDTNLFNRLLDDEIPLETFNGCTLFATHVQRNELEQTGKPDRRNQLLSLFTSVNPGELPTISAFFDVSEWDASGWGNDDELASRILQRIKEKDKGKGKDVKNQQRDALIGETAIMNGLILITLDNGLAEAVCELGGRAIPLDEFSH